MSLLKLVSIKDFATFDRSLIDKQMKIAFTAFLASQGEQSSATKAITTRLSAIFNTDSMDIKYENVSQSKLLVMLKSKSFIF